VVTVEAVVAVVDLVETEAAVVMADTAAGILSIIFIH
jgi:hypothetical protein